MADNGAVGRTLCSICLEPFKIPKILQCFHTFCAQCLRDIIKNKRKMGSFECPLCRTCITIPTKGENGFQNNFYIQDQVRDDVKLLCNSKNGCHHKCHETASSPIVGETYNLVLSCCHYGEITRQCIAKIHDAAPRKCLAPKLKSKPVNTSITLTWAAPVDDGYSSVTMYKVKMSTYGEIDNLVYSGRKAFCEVDNLIPGKKYNLYVQAQNVVGWGSWSDALEVILDPCPPGQPKCFSIGDISSSSVTLSWTDADDNGERITGYVITYNVKDDLVSSSLDVVYTTRRHVVHNLKPGTKYSFQICAVNILGKGKLSKKLYCTTIPLISSHLASVLIQAPDVAEPLEIRIKPEHSMSFEKAVFKIPSEWNIYRTPLIKTEKRLVERYSRNKISSNWTFLKRVLHYIVCIFEFLATYMLLKTYPEAIVIFVLVVFISVLLNIKQPISAVRKRASRRTLKKN